MKTGFCPSIKIYLGKNAGAKVDFLVGKITLEAIPKGVAELGTSNIDFWLGAGAELFDLKLRRLIVII